MNLLDILKKADNIEGCFVEIGFGKGKTADVVLNLMKENQIQKRVSYLVDNFRKFPIGPAMDRRHLLPGYDIKVVKAQIGNKVPKELEGIKIAVLQVDLGNFDANEKVIALLSPLLTKGGVIIPVGAERKTIENKKEIAQNTNTGIGIRYTDTTQIYLQSVGPKSDTISVGKNINKVRDKVPEVRFKR